MVSSFKFQVSSLKFQVGRPSSDYRKVQKEEVSSRGTRLETSTLKHETDYGFGVGDCTDRGRVLSGVAVFVAGCGLVRLTGALR